MTGRVRAYAVLSAFLAFTLPLMPLQWLFVRRKARAQRTFPHWYHRCVCRLIGVHVHCDGEIARDKPVLIIANHVSWLDIPVVSAAAPVSFVAKHEVAAWPLAGQLARLQRTVFINRTRRRESGQSANAIAERLRAGDGMVLFAEGTSSDGNRVLPFKSTLFAALDADVPADTVVQTLSLAYTRQHNLPLSWADRRALGYYGDVALGANAFELLGRGPLTARLRIGPETPVRTYRDRKQLAQHAEQEVRRGVIALLRDEGVSQ